MSVKFENLIVAGGTFKQKAEIEPVTVGANTTIVRGTLMGKITATGKYVESLSASNDGSEVASAIVAEEIVNDTAAEVEVKALLFKTGSFNSTGITFGAGQTVQNTKDDLLKVSIEITAGVL